MVSFLHKPGVFRKILWAVVLDFMTNYHQFGSLKCIYFKFKCIYSSPFTIAQFCRWHTYGCLTQGSAGEREGAAGLLPGHSASRRIQIAGRHRSSGCRAEALISFLAVRHGHSASGGHPHSLARGPLPPSSEPGKMG